VSDMIHRGVTSSSLSHPWIFHNVPSHPQSRVQSTTWRGLAIATSPLSPSPSASFAEGVVSTLHMTTTTTAQTIGMISIYIIAANLIYLARRAHLRKMTMKRLWEIRTTREEGMSPILFGGIVFAWQCLVLLFPLVEPFIRITTKGCIFFYSYPKAQGGGYIWEPLSCQHLNANQRAKNQIRFDWHKFAYNIGPTGKDGFRHPPTIERNLPHMDIPKYQIRHWPWRRRMGRWWSSPPPPP